MVDFDKLVDEWKETWTGTVFHPLRPDPATIHFVDIAHHLSIISRYNGATRRPYSVAEHCVLLADYAKSKGMSAVACLNILLHDAAEAYLQDILPWLKKMFSPYYQQAEESLLRMIHEVLEVPYLEERGFIEKLDKAILLDERAALCPNHKPENPWIADCLDPLGVDIKALPWDEALDEFTFCFNELKEEMDTHRNGKKSGCQHPWKEREVFYSRGKEHVRCLNCGEYLGEVSKQ